jgi:hypothetical protein
MFTPAHSQDLAPSKYISCTLFAFYTLYMLTFKNEDQVIMFMIMQIFTLE